jgi:hypothetical protein
VTSKPLGNRKTTTTSNKRKEELQATTKAENRLQGKETNVKTTSKNLRLKIEQRMGSGLGIAKQWGQAYILHFATFFPRPFPSTLSNRYAFRTKLTQI